MAVHGLVHDSAIGYYVGKSLRRSGSTRRLPKIQTGLSITHTKTVFTWSYKDIKFYEPTMHQFLNGKLAGGKPAPLWAYLERKGDLAVAGAKAQVGVKTGQLQRSIHKRHLGNPSGQYLWIGSTVPHALIHHNGSKPHLIQAAPGKNLVFTSKSRLIRTPMVMHPGSRPNRYLSSQLRHFRG